jgi:hypothetical protein
MPAHRAQQRVQLALLILFHFIIVCLSCTFVSEIYFSLFDLPHDPGRMFDAVVVVAVFTSVLLILFSFADFSFGYVVSFYFGSMIVGYLWLNGSSGFHYDHQLSAFSAAVSLLAFSLPALFMPASISRMVISERLGVFDV